ncbi:Selection and upkeep of intraepithelial T-cells protein 1, partial [Tupaia chinensis]
GMMNLKFSSFSGTYVGFILLQVITLTSEHFMVTISTGHLVAMVGGQAELSCQLFPPQDAEHMEVRWFRSDHSKPIYLYRDGHDMKGEIAPEYVHRTEFVKEAIREGKVTLRIHNISISDDGPYQCLFKDGGFSEASSMNLSVAAVGLETQIYVEPLFSDACMVECHSGGWFPQPQMEWRDDRGEVVPHSSKLPSQDGARFFHMKMTVVLTNNSQGNITCYIHNPLTGEVKQTRIILSNGLFESDYIWIVFLGLLLGIVLVCIAMHLYILLSIKKEQFTVSGSEVPILASLGGVVELSCQLFPPQSAQHMEVRWFRDRYTEPIHLYKDGKDLYGEIISKYVERTELLKEAIGEGKVTLRILNVSVEDNGQYHCFFKDSDDFYEEAVTEVQVTATSLEIQIHMHPPNTKGLLVECDSGGWFPQPQMEWRDSRGEIIPPASTTHSQDENKLFNMKMTLLLRDSSHGNVTCYLRNPVTGQEQRTSIVLSIPTSDPHFQLDIMWLEDMTVLLCVLMAFITMIISFVYSKIRGK